MIIIVMGVCGCGKTTVGRRLAERLGYVFLDADAYHSPANVQKMSQGVPLTEDDRQEWLDALRQEIINYLRRDDPAVLACSALTRRARRTLRVDPDEIRFVHLAGSVDLIRRRMEGREHFMPPDLLESQFATLEPPDADEALTLPIDDTPDALVEEIVAKLSPPPRADG